MRRKRELQLSDGYDACLASEPEYCGNGKCAGSENYNNCQQDCSSSAPKGNINVDVTYSKGANANKPIPGAYVYLDSTLKGTTGSDGKKSFEAGYGQHTVKVNCPDSSSCESRTVSVDGTKYSGFACNCNPLGDSDGDGDSDEDEKLLGTDPNNANENYKTVFFSFEYPKNCIDADGIFDVIWENKDDLAQANELVLKTINTTSVKSGLNAKITKSSTTLRQGMDNGDVVGGLFTEHGAILAITDYEDGTTAIVAISSTCVGNFIGFLYGAGTGVKDDIVGIGSLVKGILYAITNDPRKTASEVSQFINSIPELFGNAGEIFHNVITGILEKGRSVTEKTGLFKSDQKAYLNFQIGFLNGFLSGYVIEQIAAGFGASAVLKSLKAEQWLVTIGKTVKFPELLEAIAAKFGRDTASVLKKLTYAKSIPGWSEGEQNVIILMAKNKNSRKWLEGLTEAEARVAARYGDEAIKANKLTDVQLEKLLGTNLGRATLKTSGTTPELLAKQVKIVDNWGASKVDEVIKKHWWESYSAERVENLNTILDSMPENLIDDLVPDAAIKYMSDKVLLKSLKSIKNVKGFETLIGRLVREWKSPSVKGHVFHANKAAELKAAGKEIIELEKQIPGTTHTMDIVYKEGGKEIAAEVKDWNWDFIARDSQAFTERMEKTLRQELDAYITNYLKGDKSRFKLYSKNKLNTKIKDWLWNNFKLTDSDIVVG
ncbi:hypothetical protein HYU15_03055 [Candidatus Woesearchaeota archaeon]|nr:hypothetical protein [Candidatus Woesearchaeota archaeon]